MKRRRLASVIATATALPALGLGLNGAASAQAIPAGSYSKQTVVLDCWGHPHVRPGHYTIACGDGNDYLSGLAWTTWGPRLASATGTENINDCVPTAPPGTSAATRWTWCSGAARPPGRDASATPRSLCSTRVPIPRMCTFSRPPSRTRCTRDRCTVSNTTVTRRSALN